MTRQVELHQAFVWTCEDCGRDNFERGTIIEPEAMAGTPEQLRSEAELQEANICLSALDIDARVGFTWMTAPVRVTCGHCGAKFVTKDDA
jgi:hypothetical protein